MVWSSAATKRASYFIADFQGWKGFRLAMFDCIVEDYEKMQQHTAKARSVAAIRNRCLRSVF